LKQIVPDKVFASRSSSATAKGPLGFILDQLLRSRANESGFSFQAQMRVWFLGVDGGHGSAYAYGVR